jgi:hypothetical protein
LSVCAKTEGLIFEEQNTSSMSAAYWPSMLGAWPVQWDLIFSLLR